MTLGVGSIMVVPTQHHITINQAGRVRKDCMGITKKSENFITEQRSRVRNVHEVYKLEYKQMSFYNV